MWSESTNFMINVEREYKFHDQSGARVQKRHHYQREAEITINFPGSSNVRINQMRVVERTKMDEWRAQNKDWMEIQRERTFNRKWHKRRDDKGLESVARHSIEELSICNWLKTPALLEKQKGKNRANQQVGMARSRDLWRDGFIRN